MTEHTPAKVAGTSTTGPSSGRAVGNTLIQLLPPGVRLPLSILLTALLTRYLGVRGLGEYATVFAFVALYQGIFNDVGLSSIVLREIARHPEERRHIIFSAAALQAIVAAATYGLLLIGVAIVHYPSDITAGVAIFGLSLFLTPLDILALPFTADLKLAKLIPPSIVGIALNFGLVAGSLALHARLPLIILAVLVAIVIQYGIVGYISLQGLTPLARPSSAPWGSLLREALPLAMNSVLGAFTLQAPILYLSHLSLAEAGLFNAANRLPQQLLLLPFAVRATTFPLLARSWHVDRPAFLSQLTRTVAVTLLLGVPLAVGGVGFASLIVSFLFGAQFAASSLTLQLLLAQFAVLFPYIIVAEALTATGHQRINLGISIVTTPVLIVGLFLGANAAGAAGAAMALIAFYAFLLSLTLLAACVKLGSTSILRDIAFAMVVLLIGILIFMQLQGSLKTNGPQVIAAFAGTVVSGVLMVLIKREAALELLRVCGVGLSRVARRLQR